MKTYQKNRPLAHTLNNIKARLKPVLQYSLEGEFIKEWPSLVSIPKQYGFVRGCITGRQNKAGGFCWKYKSL